MTAGSPRMTDMLMTNDSYQSSPVLSQYSDSSSGYSTNERPPSNSGTLVLDFASPNTRQQAARGPRRRTSYSAATPNPQLVDDGVLWTETYAATSSNDETLGDLYDDQEKRVKAQGHRRRALSRSPQWAQRMSSGGMASFLSSKGNRRKAIGCLAVTRKIAAVACLIILFALAVIKLVKLNDSTDAEIVGDYVDNFQRPNSDSGNLQEQLTRTKHALESALDHQTYEDVWDHVIHAPQKFKKIVHDFGDRFNGPKVPPKPVYHGLNYSKILKPGTEHEPTLQGRLRDDLRYLIGIPYGGHANMFIGLQRLILFGKMTNRVAILPTFNAAHVRGSPMSAEAFYDLDRFYALTHLPVIPMDTVKRMGWTGQSPREEKVSCWSLEEKVVGFSNPSTEGFAHHDIVPQYWPLPEITRAPGGYDLSFDGLKMFDFQDKTNWIQKVRDEQLPQRDNSAKTVQQRVDNMKDRFGPYTYDPPSDHLFCLDNSFFISPLQFPDTVHDGLPLEPRIPGEGPAWNEVGQYLHFTESLELAAEEVLMDLFHVSKPSLIPPYISIHIRRGDFKDFTGFTSLERYVAGLERVRARLQERLDDPLNWDGPGRKHFKSYGISAAEYPIVATTDEAPDSDFVNQVKELGWNVIDHQAFGTEEKWGPWYASMLDAVILARGKSFVGTSASTYSHLSGLRVKFWHGGLVETA
ncbi:hypothetical protein OIO90_005597 [Microbotryomycetes sp. JL221]|nr:hypothetical protein OIO90_005597 [Microbotryomycetes sp. JL221]